MDHSSTVNLWLGNAISVGAIATSMLGYTPAIAACVALVWYFIQIYESATVQRWLAGRRVRRLARLKAQVIMLEARDQLSPLKPSKPNEPGLPVGYDH